MPKHNQFIKKLKSQFVSINNTIESYFNSLKIFITNLKKLKLSQNNKAFLVSFVIVILFISYYLIPTVYNKDLIKLEIKNQVFKKYNIDIKFNNEIKYGLLPKPHFYTKNLYILLDEKKVGIVDNFKINLDHGNFFSFNKIQFKDLIFDKTDFSINDKDMVFFEDLLKK